MHIAQVLILKIWALRKKKSKDLLYLTIIAQYWNKFFIKRIKKIDIWLEIVGYSMGEYYKGN